MLQPRAPLGRANSEPRVRFPQAQPPAALRVLFIPTQELNEEGGELFDGAFGALARKQRTQDRVLADTCVKLRREPLATCLAVQRAQQCCDFRHNRLYL